MEQQHHLSAPKYRYEKGRKLKSKTTGTTGLMGVSVKKIALRYLLDIIIVKMTDDLKTNANGHSRYRVSVVAKWHNCLSPVQSNRNF